MMNYNKIERWVGSTTGTYARTGLLLKTLQHPLRQRVFSSGRGIIYGKKVDSSHGRNEQGGGLNRECTFTSLNIFIRGGKRGLQEAGDKTSQQRGRVEGKKTEL